MLEYIAPKARIRSMIRMATEKLGVHGLRCALGRLKYASTRVSRVLTCGAGPGESRNDAALASALTPCSLDHGIGVFGC